MSKALINKTKLNDMVSVKDFGAVGNGVADDTVAVQACLDAVQASSASGGTAYLPAGEYKITSTLDLPANVSLEGEGQFSRLRVYACDGINILASNVIGPRRVANFWLYGNGADAFSGIVCDVASPGARAQGMVFEGLYIAFFGTGVKSHGMWHSVFRSCTMNQIWTGFNLYDQNVKITIDECRITHGGLVSGSGNSVGVQVGDSSYPLRPEDVQITKSLIYGFNQGIVWRTCLFGGVTNCDLDACTIEGLRLVTADGGFTFRDNWVQVDSSTVTVYGVNATSLGYTPSVGNIAISNNRLGNTTNTGTAYGILVGTNQTGLLIDNNSIAGFPVSLRTDTSKRLKITNNTFDSNLTVLNTTDVVVASNYINDFTFTNNAGLNFGANYGPLSFGTNPGVTTYIVGSVTLPSGATSVSISPGTLGLSNFNLANLRYLVTCNINGSTTRNNIWGNVTGNNNVTFYVETAVGAAESIGFCVQASQ